MDKVLLAKNVSAKEVPKIQAAFKKLGATSIKKVKNADGTFNIEATFPD
jgi:hypothetical protein